MMCITKLVPLPVFVLLSVGGAGYAIAAPENQSRLTDDIRLSTMPDGGALTTVSGDIDVASSGRALTLKTTSGDLYAGQVTGKLTVRDVSGTVKVDAAQGDVDIYTVSGDVTLGSVVGDVRFHTSSGDLRAERIDRDLSAATSSGSVTARLGWSGTQPHAASVVTASGDVVLHVPHDFAGDVDLQIVQTRPYGEDNTIVQNFGLPVVYGQWASHLASGATRRVTVRGVVGDGHDRITVQGTAASITVLRD